MDLGRRTPRAGHVNTRPTTQRDDKNVNSSSSWFAEIEAEETMRLRDGVLEVLIESRWYRVPNRLWAWAPRRITCRRCEECSFENDCRHEFHFQGRRMWRPVRADERSREYEYTLWLPKLLRTPGIDHLQSAPEAESHKLVSRLFGPRDIATLAGQLPSELFEGIYRWADGKLARTCRLVCRYWEKRCRGVAFRSISLRSKSMVYRFYHELEHDPAWQHIPSLAEKIELPEYTTATKEPWIHLLDPRWKLPELAIRGPFAGYQTMRSIHFALPRSLPRSFSQGITELTLRDVRFRRVEDTTRLASELPDLERLTLLEVRWESLPTALPRRPPRASRNKLSEIRFMSCSVKGNSSASCVFAAWTLFLGVHSPSPLDTHPVTHAFVRAMNYKHDRLSLRVETDADGGVSGLYIDSPDFPLHILRYCHEAPTRKRSLFIFLHHTHSHKDPTRWAQFTSAIGVLPESWRLLLLLGCRSRTDVYHFASDVLDKQLSSLTERGEVRYVISREERREKGRPKYLYWYGATLESEELRGKGVTDPLDVYGDWKKTLQRSKQVSNPTRPNTD